MLSFVLYRLWRIVAKAMGSARFCRYPEFGLLFVNTNDQMAYCRFFNARFVVLSVEC